MNNFLSVVWYRVLPPIYGGQKGIAEFNFHLGRKRLLTCLCSSDNKPDEQLTYELINDLPASRFQFWNRSVRKKILRLISERSFTHVIIEHPYHGWLGKYKRQLGFSFIVHAHNIEHLRMKTRGKLWWRQVKRMENDAFKTADRILFKTEADKTKAINLFDINAKSVIVPFGIMEKRQPQLPSGGKEHFKIKNGIDINEKILLFAASSGYEPNEEALEIIMDRIIPLLRIRNFSFRIVVCGAWKKRQIEQLKSIPEIIPAGFVQGLPEYILSADAFINPVVSGAGVQTKNIEAITYGCNLVCTKFAASGLPAYLENVKAFISPDEDWDQFADNIIVAASVNSAVPTQFYDDHNWTNIIDRLLPQIENES